MEDRHALGVTGEMEAERNEVRIHAKSNFSLSMKRLADSTALSVSALDGSPCGKSPSSVGGLGAHLHLSLFWPVWGTLPYFIS